MIRKLTCTLALAIFIQFSFSQNKTKDFRFEYDSLKIKGSLYNSITILDSREEKTHYGVAQVGPLNKKVFIVPKIPFADQVDQYLRDVIDTNAHSGNLLLQLRQFVFREHTTTFNEKGYCYLRINLYVQKPDGYYLVNAIDTGLVVQGMEVTRGIARKANKVFRYFITQSLIKEPRTDRVYTWKDLGQIDVLEKKDIRLYNTDSLTDGVYKTYASFSKQEPDIPVKAEIVGDVLKDVKVETAPGKLK